ncbi:MAG: type II secretion system F family protein [Candidatus Pacearchaeota archaeon]
MKIEKRHILGIITALVIIVLDIAFLRGEKVFLLLILVGFLVASLPFVLSLVEESEIEKENNERFLEFIRNIVENVKAGTPISISIVNVKNQDYGTLTPYVQKLANQISLGIPVKAALESFAKNVKGTVIKKAITLISEAERAGGDIEQILESVSVSVNEVEKLKKERKSSISNLVVQGYIIFFIFIIIILVMQFKIIPLTSELSQTASFSPEKIARPLFYLLLTQGLFAGLVIGKLAEGQVKAGIKHSFATLTMALLIYSIARIFF